MRRTQVTARIAFMPILICILSSCATMKEMVSPALYTSPNKLFTIQIPTSSNRGGAPYAIEELTDKRMENYDIVGFNVKEKGLFLVAGVRIMPDRLLKLMDKDPQRKVLSTMTPAVLYNWRSRYNMGPSIRMDHVGNSFIASKYGEAIISIFRAKEGSFITKAAGPGPTDAGRFDTLIAVLLAREGGRVIYAIAEDDLKPNNDAHLKERVKGFFDEIKIEP